MQQINPDLSLSARVNISRYMLLHPHVITNSFFRNHDHISLAGVDLKNIYLLRYLLLPRDPVSSSRVDPNYRWLGKIRRRRNLAYLFDRFIGQKGRRAAIQPLSALFCVFFLIYFISRFCINLPEMKTKVGI